VRQLLTESVLLAIVGGSAGLLIAAWTTPLLASFSPLRPPALGSVLIDFRMDGRVLAFASAVTIATGCLFGLFPAIQASARSAEVGTTLKHSGLRTGGPGGRRWMGALVIGEIALAAALLVAGSLVVQSFSRLQRVDLGFRSDHLLAAEVALPPSSYANQQQRQEFLDRVLERIRVLPGVVSAGTSTNLPLDQISYDAVFTAEGRERRSEPDVPITANRLVSPGYLGTLGVRLVSGRLIDGRDGPGTPRVVVVTEEFARQSWPNADPIGRRVRRGTAGDTQNPWLTVVGVVANVKEDVFNFRIDRPAWYLPYAQADSPLPLMLAVRTAGDPLMLTGNVRDAVRAVDPKLALANVRTLDDQIADVTITDRFTAALVAVLALTGLFLAACGLYGVVAYSVGQRTREIGVRIALGASPAAVVLLIVREGGLLIAAGIAAGLVAARASTSVLANLLYEVRAGDVGTFAAVAVTLAAIGLLACLLPARRASRLNPAVALKAE
jgi:putative ABC transport system permease protein